MTRLTSQASFESTLSESNSSQVVSPLLFATLMTWTCVMVEELIHTKVNSSQINGRILQYCNMSDFRHTKRNCHSPWKSIKYEYMCSLELRSWIT